MTYGFRLNLEQFYYEEALKHFKIVKAIDPLTRNNLSALEELKVLLLNPLSYIKAKKIILESDIENPMALKAFIMGTIAKSLVFHCLTIESYVYLLYRYSKGKYNGSSLRMDEVSQEIKKIDKWHKVYKQACINIGWDDGLLVSEIISIQELFRLRNSFVHYKDGVVWTGFSSTGEVEEILTLPFLIKTNLNVENFVLKTKDKFNLEEGDYSFINEQYSYNFYSG